ncbi:serine hydrolase domain-containing protein [Maribacter thermophilus]|uniref:serine hydrolase domain-containing protein n=1 Tax=Maribacter thermophilus TaxID=1197874 RepID=UPI000640E796|nr:serine hydrolase domain-containing protein [Maribacter thermophilus]
MHRFLLFTFFSLLIISGCSTDQLDDTEALEENNENSPLYFPPIDSDTWETSTIEELGWNKESEQLLYDFLETNSTDAFILLKDGKIVLEKYFGDFTASRSHSWNSAAKTLTSMTIGIAQNEGLLSLDDSSALYLGNGWSSMTTEQENNITIRHHLTMTTGMDYNVDNNFCTDKECFLYKNEPGTYWYYHQGAYTKLDDIITAAVGQSYIDYFNNRIGDKIGMEGIWTKVGYNNLYFSNARSMARFGLLNLNEGVWNNTVIIEDKDYFNAATNTSQDLNESYGYLYWLNGKDSYKLPSTEEQFQGKLIPNAPDDLYAGLGAFDQKLYIVPSKNLVIVRFGDAADTSSLAFSSFDNDLWEALNKVIN